MVSAFRKTQKCFPVFFLYLKLVHQLGEFICSSIDTISFELIKPGREDTLFNNFLNFGYIPFLIEDKVIEYIGKSANFENFFQIDRPKPNLPR